MDAVPTLKPYLSSRFIDYSQFSYYYAYGNTQPEDLLEYVHVEDEKEPAILSLGCGDIRSCLYTLWKHFDPDVSGRLFVGVRFVLNDMSAAVLARNVLFLYLALRIPPWTEREAAKQWIASMWAIWYCHELLPAHDRMLKEALDTLLSFSDTMEAWKESSNTISVFVSFTDSATLGAINRMWKLWRAKSFKPSCKSESMRDPLVFVMSYIKGVMVWLKEVGLSKYITKEACDNMIHTCCQYASEGSVYAEECLDLACSSNSKVLNPTLYEREDGVYTLHYASSPFICFYHGLFFSKLELKKLIGMVPESALIVENDSFLKRPLLSNCVQQFSMWISSSAAILNAQICKQKIDVTFSFNCSDCVTFLDELQNQSLSYYDTIFTSNLTDRLPLPVVVLAVKPLLKISSYVITTSLYYKQAFSSSEEYLASTFGFDASLLPVVFGIRCIGIDGKYADTISSFPMPISLQELLLQDAIESGMPIHREKVFLWQRIDSQPTIIDSMEETIFSALFHKVFYAQLLSFYLVNDNSLFLKVAMCTETAITTILSFVSQLDADVDISSQSFWNSLCILLQSEPALRPLLFHIQTQALLHGLHFHLALIDKNCPVCLKKPLHDHICRCSIEFNPLSMDRIIEEQGPTPAFVVIIHKVPAVIFRTSNLFVDDHIIDSFHAIKLGDKLQLTFFVPNEWVDEYFCTVVRYANYAHNQIPVASLSKEVSQLKVPFHQELFYFRQAGAHRTKTMLTSLGRIVSHCGHSDQFKTTLALGAKPVSLLSAKTATISMKQMSLSKIQVVCGKHHLSLAYPYPIDYNNIKVQVSRSKGTVKIFTPRTNNCVYNENRVFLANPNNLIMLPSLQLSPGAVETISGMQFSEKERLMSRRLGQMSPLLPVVVKVKNIFTFIFEKLEQSSFFAFANSQDDILALLFIHRKAIEIQRCTPVLDVFYTFHDRSLLNRLFKKLPTYIQNAVYLEVDEETWPKLKQVLIYFTKRTQPTLRSAGSLLSKHRLEKAFTRAILYPLYCDQDAIHKLLEENNLDACLNSDLLDSSKSSAAHLPSTATHEPKKSATINVVDERNNCNYCKKRSDELRKCTRCRKTNYCSKECQTNDWKEHKIVCKPPPADCQPEKEKCSNCGKESAFLKRCARCHLAAYCTKECQTNDWARHKPTCAAPQ